MFSRHVLPALILLFPIARAGLPGRRRPTVICRLGCCRTDPVFVSIRRGGTAGRQNGWTRQSLPDMFTALILLSRLLGGLAGEAEADGRFPDLVVAEPIGFRSDSSGRNCLAAKRMERGGRSPTRFTGLILLIARAGLPGRRGRQSVSVIRFLRIGTCIVSGGIAAVRSGRVPICAKRAVHAAAAGRMDLRLSVPHLCNDTRSACSGTGVISNKSLGADVGSMHWLSDRLRVSYSSSRRATGDTSSDEKSPCL